MFLAAITTWKNWVMAALICLIALLKEDLPLLKTCRQVCLLNVWVIYLLIKFGNDLWQSSQQNALAQH